MQDVIDAIDREIQAAVLAARARGLSEGWAAGEARGQAEGEAEGEAKGRRAMLLLVLRQRFPDLPSRFEAEVHAGGIAQLDAWGDRVLTARTPEDIFDNN